jgi:hypothetical protein
MTPKTMSPREDETPPPEQSHTIGVATVLESGDLGDVQMILGDRRQVRPAGIIRPGIKVPTGACSKEQIAKYEAMLAEGASFDTIDQALISMAGKTAKRSYLRPSNADHFTVRAEDFRNPADAQRLLDLYADPADGKLRAFPVWFPQGGIAQCIPHNFRGFVGGGIIRYASYYAPDGELRCRWIDADAWAKIQKESRGPKRADYAERHCPGDRNKENDPDLCPDYKAKRCRFGGLYRCNVPGVSGIGEVIIPTNSWYGLGDAVANLYRVQDVFGRIHGLFHGQPFLEARKVQEEVSHEGQRGLQWIITVMPSVDMMELAAANEPGQVAARARAALTMLGGPPTHHHGDHGAKPGRPPPDPAPIRPAPAPPVATEDDLERAHQEAMAEGERVTGPAAGEIAPEVEAAAAKLRADCEAAGMPWDHISAWLAEGWGVRTPEVATLSQLGQVRSEIRKRWNGDRQAFLDEIADMFRTQLAAEVPFQGDELPFGD